MRIGMLTYDFYPFIGGQGRVTYDLWRRLRERDDLDISVLSPARNDLAGHRTRFAFTRRYGRHPAFSLLASRAIRRWCHEQRLDVLHVNGGPGGVLLLTDPGVPVVYSLYHTYEQVARLMPGHGWKAPVTTIERAAYGRASVVTASTQSSSRSLTERLGIKAPVHVIPCGVDFGAFPFRRVERDPATVLFVGRLDHRKNPELLVRAFATLAGSHAGARLVIVGQGSLEPRLRRLAREIGAAERVRFEHFVGHDELVNWYNRASLVVVPSRFEGFGLSAVEAQSCGACVVATDTEGLRDVVIDGETGALAAPDPMSLAETIARLLDDAPRRHALGAAAAEHVRRAYAWDGIVERYVQMYREAAGGTSRERRAD